MTEEQRRVASKHGDVHTAVEWYLKWFPEQRLAEVDNGIFNVVCFRRMHSTLRSSREEFVVDPEVTDYEWRLVVAIGFVWQKDIVCAFGNTCVTCHIDEDSRRASRLEFLNAEVQISELSVCNSDAARENGLWLVYVKAGTRSPHVSTLTVLPTNIAVYFSHFRFRLENKFDFCMAFRTLLEDPERSALLLKFASLLAGGDAVVELDTPI